MGRILPTTASPGLLRYQAWPQICRLPAAGSSESGSRSMAGERVRAGRASELVRLVFQGHRGGGKERKESEKKKVDSETTGNFLPF